jgi:hypothetical protein
MFAALAVSRVRADDCPSGFCPQQFVQVGYAAPKPPVKQTAEPPLAAAPAGRVCLFPRLHRSAAVVACHVRHAVANRPQPIAWVAVRIRCH